MAKAELKTKQNSASVSDFINSIEDETQKADSIAINKMMEEIVGEKGKMWGASIIGYGLAHLKYESGRELDWMKVGFSPRKGKITLYLNYEYYEKYPNLMEKLGKHDIGKGCLYIKKLSDVDESVLRELIRKGFGK